MQGSWFHCFFSSLNVLLVQVLDEDILCHLSCFYVGITCHNDLWQECLRWLTARGQIGSDGKFTGAKNRPTLPWADGSQITMHG